MINNIQKIIEIYNSFGKVESFDWLDGRNFSDAFVLCISSGPWMYARRKTVQEMAINTLNGRDLSQIEIRHSHDYVPEQSTINWFPLVWQNKYLFNMVKYLQENDLTMEEYCERLICGHPIVDRYNPHSRKFLYEACGQPKGIKVLSLFCRDALKIPAFPIDRHVRKYLIEQNLPVNEDDMIELCFQANLDPNLVATGVIKNIGDLKNPDWKI